MWKILKWEFSIYFSHGVILIANSFFFSHDTPVCMIFLIGLSVFPEEQILSVLVEKS